MHNATSYKQAGATLLAAAMRDPAPILNMDTFWRFMQVVEQASGYLTDGERTSSAYQEHVAYYDRIYRLQHDITPVDEDWMCLGPQLTCAFAAYAEQAAALLTLLLDHRPAAHLAPLLQEFEQVMQQVAREVREVPGSAPVQHALAAFEQC
jgi:hypothetical protein